MSDHPFEARSGKTVVAVGVCTLCVAVCVALGIAAVADPITVQTCGSEFNFAMNVTTGNKYPGR